MYYVYKMIHTKTGRVYIGQRKLTRGKTPETDCYYGSGKVWSAIYKAHPEECVKVILEVVKTKKEVDELERKYIAHYRSVYGGLCVNIADGGEGGCGKLSAETKRKISESHKGMKHTEAAKAKMRGRTSPNKGKHLSEETKRKIGEANRIANKGKHPSEETRRKLSEANKDFRHTEEAKRRIGDANRGRKFSEEHRKKIAEAHKGKQLSEEHRKSLSKANKGKPWSAARREAYERKKGTRD